MGLTRAEIWSVVTTAGLAFVFIAAAAWTFGSSPLVLAVSLGCVGGLMHELAQSGGKISTTISPTKRSWRAWG